MAIRERLDEIRGDGQRIAALLDRPGRLARASQAELLEVQLLVHRQARDVELCTRLVDRLTGAARQLVQQG